MVNSRASSEQMSHRKEDLKQYTRTIQDIKNNNTRVSRRYKEESQEKEKDVVATMCCRVFQPTPSPCKSATENQSYRVVLCGRPLPCSKRRDRDSAFNRFSAFDIRQPGPSASCHWRHRRSSRRGGTAALLAIFIQLFKR